MCARVFEQGARLSIELHFLLHTTENYPLMREIYEVEDLSLPRTAADIHPGYAAFWKYRTRLTVEQVIRQYEDIKSNMASCKVLGKFLVEVI